MSASPMISRRRALALLAALPIAACTNGGARSNEDGSADPLDEADSVDAFVRVGRRRNELVPEEADVAFLRGSLGVLDERDARPELPEELTAQVRADYANDQTELLDGWLLSTTEARATALVALSE